MPDATEDGAPNGGDGNADGTPDSQQLHVSSLPNAVDGNYLTLAAPSGTSLGQVRALGAPPPPANPPAGETFPVGLIAFTLSPMPAPPSSIVVTLLLESSVPITGYWRYGPEPGDPTDHWYSFHPLGGSPATGASFVSPATQIDLTFVDGARGDDDLTADGVLVDQGGPSRAGSPAGGPTGVDLRSFQGIGLRDQVIVVWETVVEIDMLGFNLHRSASATGPWMPVNTTLLPALGTGTSGYDYTLRDAPGPGTFWYRLDAVDAGGKGSPIATIKVRAGPGATGRRVFLPNLKVGRGIGSRSGRPRCCDRAGYASEGSPLPSSLRYLVPPVRSDARRLAR